MKDTESRIYDGLNLHTMRTKEGIIFARRFTHFHQRSSQLKMPIVFKEAFNNLKNHFHYHLHHPFVLRKQSSGCNVMAHGQNRQHENHLNKVEGIEHTFSFPVRG